MQEQIKSAVVQNELAPKTLTLKNKIAYARGCRE